MAFSDQESPYSGGKFITLLGGYGASQLLGANLWLPLLLTFATIFAIGRLFPRIAVNLRYALGVMIGQLLWVVVALIIQPAQISSVLVDLILGFGIAGGCIVKPSKIFVGLLLFLQSVTLAINLFVAYKLGEWGPSMAAILVHIAMRVAAIILAVMALRAGPLLRRDDGNEAEEIFA